MRATTIFQRDTRLSRLRKWRAGCRAGPWEICVFPTERCNLRCEICWQHWLEEEKGKIDPAREVPDQRLLHLVDEAAELGVRDWAFAGGGEPMIRADLIMEMCAHLRRRGMNGFVITNGTRLSEERLKAFVDMGWRRLTISLDGPDADTNDAIRNAGTFEKATNALKTLKEIKRSCHTDQPLVATATVITNRNYDRLEELVALAAQLGVSSMAANVLQSRGTKCAAFRLSEAQRADLPRHVEKAVALARKSGIDAGFTSLVTDHEARDPDGYVQQTPTAPNQARFENALCFEPFLSINITAQGGLAGPCSNFWSEEAQNIGDSSLEEVWFGPYMEATRKAILTHEKPPGYCAQSCSILDQRTNDLREGLRLAQRYGGVLPSGILDAARRGTRSLKHRGLLGAARHAYNRLRVHG